MNAQKPLFPEDNNFFSNFLENELIYSPQNFSPSTKISADNQDTIINKIIENEYKTCLIFKSLDENLQLKKDSFLDKVLKSVNIELSKSLIINLEKFQQIQFSELHKTKKFPFKTILFGVNSSDLNLNVILNENRVNIILNYQIIKTLNLHELEHAVEAKKIFWKQLQAVFLKK